KTLNRAMLAETAISDDGANIRLDEKSSNKKITIREMQKARTQALQGTPLIFMNACGSAQGDFCYPSPFIFHFMRTWTARGFVGTDWSIPTEFADVFGRQVLKKLCDGTEILDAFHELTRSAADANNPFGLIYALYASPELSLRDPSRG